MRAFLQHNWPSPCSCLRFCPPGDCFRWFNKGIRQMYREEIYQQLLAMMDGWSLLVQWPIASLWGGRATAFMPFLKASGWRVYETKCWTKWTKSLILQQDSCYQGSYPKLSQRNSEIIYLLCFKNWQLPVLWTVEWFRDSTDVWNLKMMNLERTELFFHTIQLNLSESEKRVSCTPLLAHCLTQMFPFFSFPHNN